MNSHEIHRPYLLRQPPQREVHFSYGESDPEAFFAEMAVYTPFDEDRIAELEEWRGATDAQRGEAFSRLMTIVEAMKEQIQPKPPLYVRFPKPYNKP